MIHNFNCLNLVIAYLNLTIKTVQKNKNGENNRAVTVSVTTASPAGRLSQCCLLPPAVVHVMSHTL